jgi:type II secretion system protein G
MQLKRKSKGFTLIELMVVIVIIGILVAIALPNFISAQDRAKLSSVKANAHTMQTMLETYAVDWQSVYPNGTTSLKTEASSAATNKYWKELKNPFTANTGVGLDTGATTGTLAIDTAIATDNITSNNTSAAATVLEGVTYYSPSIDATSSIATKYWIYGGDKSSGGGKLIAEKGTSPFILSNS